MLHGKLENKIILASKSLRRQQLMNLLEVDFKIIEPDLIESFNHKLSLEAAVMDLALQKAQAVALKSHLTIGADTVVVIDNQILGKPKDKAEAFSILKQLSGKVHQVITGVCFLYNEEKLLFYEKTHVLMYQLSDQEILDYIKKEEPYDKAGAYGIQGHGGLLVKEIIGDYYNVVGFPIGLIKRKLKEFLSDIDT